MIVWADRKLTIDGWGISPSPSNEFVLGAETANRDAADGIRRGGRSPRAIASGIPWGKAAKAPCTMTLGVARFVVI
jgi:hypothetical protein